MKNGFAYQSYGNFFQLLQFSTHQLREKMSEVCLHASLNCYFNGELVSNTPYACLSYHSFDIAMLIECCIKVAIAQKSLWTSHTSESNFTLLAYQ